MSSTSNKPTRKAPPPPKKPPPAPPVSRDKPLPTGTVVNTQSNNATAKNEMTSIKGPAVKMRPKINDHGSKAPQKSSIKNKPKLSRDSTSFTTEDMDLFDKRKKNEGEPKKNGIREGVRLSSKKDKRRSKSVGAPGFAGIKVRPVKPAVPVKPKFMENLITGEGLPVNSTECTRETLYPPTLRPAEPTTKCSTIRPKTAILQAKPSNSSSYESRASIQISGSPTSTSSHMNRMSVVKDGASFVRQHSRESKASDDITGNQNRNRILETSKVNSKDKETASIVSVTPVQVLANNFNNIKEPKTSCLKKGSPKGSPHESPRSSPVPMPNTPPLKPKPLSDRRKLFGEKKQTSSPTVSPEKKVCELSSLNKTDSEEDHNCSSILKETQSDSTVMMNPGIRQDSNEDAFQKKPRLKKQRRVAQQEQLDVKSGTRSQNVKSEVKSEVNVVVIHSPKGKGQLQSDNSEENVDPVVTGDIDLKSSDPVSKKEDAVRRSRSGMKVVHIKRQTLKDSSIHHGNSLQTASSSPELSRNTDSTVAVRKRSSSAFSVAHLTEFFRRKLSVGVSMHGATFYNSSDTNIDKEQTSGVTQDGVHQENIYDNAIPAPKVPPRDVKDTCNSLDVPIALTDDSDLPECSQYENIEDGAKIYGNIEIRRNTAGRNDLLKPQVPNKGVSHEEPVKPTLTSRETTNSVGPQLPSRGYSLPGATSVDLTLPPENDLDQVVVYDMYDDTVLAESENLYQDIDLDGGNSKSRQKVENIYNLIDEQEMTSQDDSEAATDEDYFDDFLDSDDEFEEELYSKLPAFERQITVDEEEVPLTKLGKIVKELLQTERAYVKRLHLLDQVFHFTVVLKNRAFHMFPDEIIPEMFSNIKSVYQFHHDFLLPQLEKRWKDWDANQKIGDIMKKFAPFLKLYIEYVKNFDNAMNVISTWMERSPQFADIIHELQRRPECGNLALQHHMLEPIQRVPRYQLLLADYVKHLPEDSNDMEDAKAALDLVTKAAAGSNEAMKKIETFRKLLEINDSLGGVIDLVDPSRELIKEGKITKISARNGEQHERYVFLFNDFMLVCQSQLIGIKQNYRLKAKLDIEGMEVQDGHNLELPNTFNVKSKTKSMEFYTNSHEEKMEWHVTLLHVVAEYHRKQMSRQAGAKIVEMFQNKELGKRAPTWVKDQETSMCMQCGTEFSKFFRRRHHCRACGKVVCGNCSRNEARLAYDDNKLNRVCADCFHVLGGQSTNGSPSVNRTPAPSPRRRKVLQVKASDPSVLSGYLNMSVDKRNWHKRWFAAHEDFVLYSFKAHQDVAAMTSLPLPGYTVTKGTHEENILKDHVFKLHHKAQKSYYFQAENNDVMKSWLAVLEKMVMLELPNRKSRSSSSQSVSNTDNRSSNLPDSTTTEVDA